MPSGTWQKPSAPKGETRGAGGDDPPSLLTTTGRRNRQAIERDCCRESYGPETQQGKDETTQGRKDGAPEQGKGPVQAAVCALQ